MKEFQITVVAETLGGAGAKCFFGGEVLKVAGKKVHCVDTNGAGDAFWGAFLASLYLQGVRKTTDITTPILSQALRYGNAAGAVCVQKKGSIPALPARAQIESFLAEDEI